MNNRYSEIRSWQKTPLYNLQNRRCEACEPCEAFNANVSMKKNYDLNDKRRKWNTPEKQKQCGKLNDYYNKGECDKDEPPTYASDLSTLSTIMFDIIGAMAFFIMATSIFWITAGFYLKTMLIKLFHTKRRTQIIVWCLIALGTLAIAVHGYISLKHHRMPNEQDIKHSPTEATKVMNNKPTVTKKSKGIQTIPSSQPNTNSTSNSIKSSRACRFFCPKLKAKSTMKIPAKAGKCPQSDDANAKCNNSNNKNYNNNKNKSNKINSPPTCLKNRPCELSKQTIAENVKSSLNQTTKTKSQISFDGNSNSMIQTMCDLLDGCNVCDSANSNSCLPLSDEDGFKIYNRYRWYCIPLEMKSPPALLVLIKDYFSNCAN